MQKITKNLIRVTILLLPAYLIRLSVFGIPTNVLEILILLAFISCLAESRHSLFEFYKKYKVIFWAVLAIFAGLIISTLANHNYTVGLGIIKSWFILPLAFAWVIYGETKRAENLESIYKWLYLSAFWVAVSALVYYINDQLTYDGRLAGFFNSPNYLAMYLAPAIIIGVESIKYKVLSKRNKAAYFISFLFILVSFYLTYSYAAWAAVTASLFIAGFIKNKNKINLKKISAVAAIIILVILSQWNNLKFKDFRTLGERSSFESRIIIWKSATKILGDNIFFGIGPGNFQNKYLEYQKYFPPYLEWAVPHPHNLYLAFWLYGGIMGLAGFLALVVVWFKEMIKKEKNSLWAVSVGITLYFLIHGLADTTYFKNDLAIVFWINFVMLL